MKKYKKKAKLSAINMLQMLQNNAKIIDKKLNMENLDITEEDLYQERGKKKYHGKKSVNLVKNKYQKVISN